MKKLFLIVGGILVLAVGGAAIFLATFDANKYKPLIEQKISEATGAGASIERVSLGWMGGLKFQMKGLTLKHPATGTVVASVETAAAGIKVMPLLSKKIEITEVSLIRPKADLVRLPNGSVTIEGVTLPEKPATAENETPVKPSSVPPDFFIASVKIEDGEFTFTDTSKEPAFEIAARHIDVTLKNVSAKTPIEFTAKAALLSEEQNLGAIGTIRLPASGTAASLDNFTLETDLSKLDREGLLKLVPALASYKIESMGGRFRLEIAHLDLDSKAMATLKANLSLAGGHVETGWLNVPVEKLTISAVAEPGTLTMNELSGRIGTGQFKAVARLSGLDTAPTAEFKGQGLNLPVEAFLNIPEGAPSFRGKLSVDLQGGTQSLEQPGVIDTLNAQGRIQVKDGVLLNMDKFEKGLSKGAGLDVLSIVGSLVPGLGGPGGGLGLTAPQMPIAPVDVPVVIQNGTVLFDNLQIMTQNIGAYARGQYNLHGPLTASASVLVSQEFTTALSKKAPQVLAFANAQGQIEVPVTIEGTVPHLRVQPNREYLASRVIGNLGGQGEGLLSGLLGKAKQGTEEGGEQAGSSVENLLKYF